MSSENIKFYLLTSKWTTVAGSSQKTVCATDHSVTFTVKERALVCFCATRYSLPWQEEAAGEETRVSLQ